MEIEKYDRVLLKSGHQASIVEIFDGGKSFIADIDRGGETYTEEITLESIRCILDYKSKSKLDADEMLSVYETQIEDMLRVFHERLEELKSSINKSEFECGRELAYQEVVEIIQTRYGMISDVLFGRES